MKPPRKIILGDVVAITKGKKISVIIHPSKTSKRLIGIDDLRNDNFIRYSDDKSGTEVFPNDILIAWDGANAGTIGFGKSGLIGSTIARLRLNEKSKFYAPFLGAFLKSKFGYLRQTSTGATIPHISRKALEGIVLPEINFDSQKRIAYLLTKVGGLITQRKNHLQKLEEFLKSVFLEMFSPKAPDYERWPLVEINDLAAPHKGAMRTGPFGSNLLHSEFNKEGDVAVLGIDNAVQNRFAWGERRFITLEKYRGLENYRIYPSDVIVTIMGTIGRSAVVPNDVPLSINTKHLVAITLNKTIANPLFISYSIHSSPFILNQFRSKNRGAIMSGLNLGIIKETKLKRPPLDLQNHFSAIHEKIDEIRSRYQESLLDLESLYGALSQKAYKGELDLSRVPLPTELSMVIEGEKSGAGDKQLMKSKFTLPAPSNLKNLHSSGGRKVLLGEWLSIWLEQLGGEPFVTQSFMETAQRRLWELTEDDPPNWGAGEYDELKTWVFGALEQGRLTQTYDDDNNHVQLKTVGK